MCVIVDAFSRMILGWRVGSHMRTKMILDATERARWPRGHHHTDLRCHSGAGVSIHVDPLQRTPCRDRHDTVDRNRQR